MFQPTPNELRQRTDCGNWKRRKFTIDIAPI